MVTGQHAEAAGVDGQTLVYAELHGEVGDATDVLAAVLALEPSLAVEVALQRAHALLDARHVRCVCRRRLQARRGQLGQQRQRVLRDLREELGIEVAEEGARGAIPRPVQVARQADQPGQWRGDDGDHLVAAESRHARDALDSFAHWTQARRVAPAAVQRKCTTRLAAVAPARRAR
jgi:hypothetical protein